MADQPSIRAVIFDLGGVLLRTEDLRPRTALAERMRLTRQELEKIVFENPISQQAERGLATPAQAWAEIAQTVNLPVEEMPAFEKEFFRGDRVDFAMIQWIRRLRPAFTTALLSNTWIVDLPKFLRENLQIPDTFDIIISSAHRHFAKPDPEIYRLALDLVNASPEEAIFIDDSYRNIEAAAALGIRVIHFKNADQARDELMALLGIAKSGLTGPY